MTEDVYRELQQHLDGLPVGFPATESGVEIKILKHLFTPEEAEIAIKMKMMPEPINKLYRRVKRMGFSIEELEEKLNKMVEKGCINRFKREENGKTTTYFANAFLVVGMFEYQINRLSKEFILDFHQYLDEAFKNEFNPVDMPQLRTIPVGQSITNENTLATYDNLRDIIKGVRGQLSLANCICRQGKDILDDPCTMTDDREWCLQFGMAAQLYIDRGVSREINKDEALQIVQKAEDIGFVIQPSNSQRPFSICLCCGCCCEVLHNAKRFDRPVEIFATNYYAEVDEDLCSGCETCVERCQMEAVSMEDNISTIDLDRCIGCGLCVMSCPSEAISLRNKDNEIVPPRHTIAFFEEIMDRKAEQARAKKNSANS